MKKGNIIIICLCIIIVILLGVCIGLYVNSKVLEENRENYREPIDYNVENNNSNNYISNNEAILIALNSLNINQNDVYDLDSELDYKYGTNVYEIDFKYNGFEYDFYIDAKTGEIIKSFKERD